MADLREERISIPFFHVHRWERWSEVAQATGLDTIQARKCIVCGVIKTRHIPSYGLGTGAAKAINAAMKSEAIQND